MMVQSGRRIVVGADDAGIDMARKIIAFLTDDPRIEVVSDLSSRNDEMYPEVAIRVGEGISRGEFDRGILICGTGIGVSITANKVPGIRAAVIQDQYSLERSILSNDCQILCFGSRIIAVPLSLRLVDQWLDINFDSLSKSSLKLSKIADFENRLQTELQINVSGTKWQPIIPTIGEKKP